MPYPRNARGRSSAVMAEIRKLITDFVMSVAVHLLREGRVSIVLLAQQHLAWKLPTELATSSGVFLRE
eukprot:3631885-Amphidinium_carterae.1